jgi:hypothetical protein
MQDVAGFELNCTANDVRVSGVSDVTEDGIVDEDDITFAPVCDAMASNAGADCSADASICLDGDGNSAPSLCGDRCAFPGDTTTFSATFVFELNAQERHDVGAFFEVTPDLGGDGALGGTCDIVTLPEFGAFARPDATNGNFVDLDTGCKGGKCPQPEDLCGDIDDLNNPIFYDMKGPKPQADTITAVCVDPDGDGFLNLPNCTSWRQSGANEVCLSGSDAFPGSPSKCNCDPNFQLPIAVPSASITVSKTALPTSTNEPGAAVQFSVSVTNDSPFANVTISSLLDDIYGNITQVQGDISSTNCSVPQDLGPAATYSCSFMAQVSGLGNTSHTNTVTAAGIDENQNPISESDDATVNILDVAPNMTVVKSVEPGSLAEPGGNFTFTVRVNNTSAIDDLSLTALLDDIYGDITQVQGKIISTNCAVPQTILQGSFYQCSFTVTELQSPGWSQTDVVTATANDDEGNILTKKDTAIIEVTNVPSSITLVKTVSPTSLNEPGGDVTYTYSVTNDSTVDSVSIDSLIDDKLGNLDGQGDCDVTPPQTLAANGGNYTCQVTTALVGNAEDVITNEATASGQDDDGTPVSDKDTATVNIDDVQPAASLTKVPSVAVVTYVVTVTNDSTAEELDLDALSDDQFGDLTEVDVDVLRTSCSVPQTIAVGGNYSCEFDGVVGTSPHTNIVSGTVTDDDDNTVTPDPSDSATVTFTSN